MAGNGEGADAAWTNRSVFILLVNGAFLREEPAATAQPERSGASLAGCGGVAPGSLRAAGARSRGREPPGVGGVACERGGAGAAPTQRPGLGPRGHTSAARRGAGSRPRPRPRCEAAVPPCAPAGASPEPPAPVAAAKAARQGQGTHHTPRPAPPRQLLPPERRRPARAAQHLCRPPAPLPGTCIPLRQSAAALPSPRDPGGQRDLLLHQRQRDAGGRAGERAAAARLRSALSAPAARPEPMAAAPPGRDSPARRTALPSLPGSPCPGCAASS